MKFKLVPTDDRFFELFEESAENVAECGRRLRDLIADPHDLETRHLRVVECERRGDELTDEILQRLNTSFVTPFDREDIHALAEELDNVVDDMLEVSHKLQLSALGQPLPELKEQAELLVQMAEETVSLLARLESMRNVKPHLQLIDRLESEGDSLYRRTLQHLLSGDYDALDVIRWKDVVEAMEAALNSLEDISNVVESIIVKHA